MSLPIINFIRARYFLVSFISGLVIAIFGLLGLLINPTSELSLQVAQVGGVLMALVSIISFIQFFTSERRITHQFNAVHASSALSGFYKIYFPIIILSIVVQVVTLFALLPESMGGWALLDPDVSPTGWLAFSIIPAIVTGIGLIILSDLELRKQQILYAPRKKNMELKGAFFYALPLVGLYFGITIFVRFILELSFGPGALIPIAPNIYRLDGLLIDASRFWIFLTQREKILTLVGFIVLYIGYEYVFRGLIGNHMRSMGLGAGGIVFVPAVVQAFALSSGNLLFTDRIYYFYIIFESLIFGIVLGILLWRTGRYGVTIIVALGIRFLDSTSDFQRTVLYMLPEPFGEYDPADSIVTLADRISTYITFFQIILIIFSPFILLAAYNETWKVITTLITDLRNQWFGYFVLGFAFFLIDLIFSYFAAASPIPLLGFVISLLVIGFVLGFLFKVLPQPDMLTMASMQDRSIYNMSSEFPLNPALDIAYLDSEEKWYLHPKRMGFIISISFLYMLFLSASYRQYRLFDLLEAIQYTTFLIMLPMILLGLSTYHLIRAIKRGYYFGENWRKNLFTVLFIVLGYNFITWIISGSLALFSWRSTTFFIVFLLAIYPKPLRTPIRDFSNGFSGSGRIATFRFISTYPAKFEDVYLEILNLNSDQSLVGTKIMAARLGYIEDWQELEILRDINSSIAEKIAATFVLGILRSKSAEGALLKQIEHENVDLKMVSYWALGKLGNANSLSRMARILEENPIKDLLPVAEKAILTIDPLYPLAGLRDNITFE